MAVVTSNPEAAVRILEEEALIFGGLSGYSLNKGKTQIIINEYTVINDSRVVESTSYLGVTIRVALDAIVNENLNPVAQKTKIVLQKLDTLHLTLVG